MKNLLLQHFNSLSDDFYDSFNKLKRQSNQSSIHKLRVTIKRIRALLAFVKYLEPEKVETKKEYQKLKLLFKRAGKIRNGHIQSKLIKDLISPQENVAKKIQEIKLKAKDQNLRFRKTLTHFHEKKIIESIETKIKDIGAYNSSRLLAQSIHEFAVRYIKKSVKHSKKSSFHKARIALKHTHYVLEIIKNKDQKASVLIATIDPIEKRIGKWQDYRVTFKLLNKKNEGKRNPGLTMTIEKEINRLEIQIMANFVRLHNAIR